MAAPLVGATSLPNLARGVNGLCSNSPSRRPSEVQPDWKLDREVMSEPDLDVSQGAHQDAPLMPDVVRVSALFSHPPSRPPSRRPSELQLSLKLSRESVSAPNLDTPEAAQEDVPTLEKAQLERSKVHEEKHMEAKQPAEPPSKPAILEVATKIRLARPMRIDMPAPAFKSPTGRNSPRTPGTPGTPGKTRSGRTGYMDAAVAGANSASAPTTPAKELPPSIPGKSSPWQAQVARAENKAKRNQGEGQRAAVAAKALRNRQVSSASLNLSAHHFPVPGQAPSPPRKGSITSDGSSVDARSIWGSVSNVPGRSLAACGAFSGGHKRNGSPSRTVGSGHKSPVSSLGADVGFTFKNTTNFVHPNKQVPRAFKRRASIKYEEEPEEALVERMNSVTSDGGWATGWSVAGSQTASAAGSVAGDAAELAPEDTVEPILEDMPLRSMSIISRDVDDDDLPPSRSSSPFKSNEPQTRPGRSLRARASSLSIRRRAKEDSDDASLHSASPVRASIDKTFGGLLSRDGEPEDATSRAANIAAARRAFEEKEASKDKKAAEQEARRRRRSESKERPHWMRRPSEAIDSAVASIEEEVDSEGNVASGKRKPRYASPSRDEDPLSRVPEQDGDAGQAGFPEYHESKPDHSMFSSTYQEHAALESGPFPPPPKPALAAGGLFPAVSVAATHVYEADGVFYDEYGEALTEAAAAAHVANVGVEQRGRSMSLSKTKVAKGKLSKLSAWGKTRMLRAA